MISLAPDLLYWNGVRDNEYQMKLRLFYMYKLIVAATGVNNDDKT